MKDKWINSGYEGDDLKPHIEPVEDYSDPARIGESAASNRMVTRLCHFKRLSFTMSLFVVVCVVQR